MNRTKKKFLRNKCGYGLNLDLKYSSPEVQTALKEYSDIKKEKESKMDPDLRGKKMTMSKMILGPSNRRGNRIKSRGASKSATHGAFGSVSDDRRMKKMMDRFNKQFDDKLAKMRKQQEERRKQMEEDKKKKEEEEAKKKIKEVESKQEGITDAPSDKH